MNHICAPLASIFLLHYHSLTPLTEDYLAERDEVLLLEVGHGGADVAADAAAGGRGGVEGDDVEDAAAVEEEARLVDDEDLGRVEGAAGERVRVDVPRKGEGRGGGD